MDSVFTPDNDKIENASDAQVLEPGADSRKIITFIFSTNHDLGISQRISGEKIYNKRNEDCRDRMMRYLSYCRLI